MFTVMFAVAWRDLRLNLRRPGDVLNPIVFFLMVSTLFPLAVGPDSETLAEIGPGVTWVAALLAMLLSLNNLFMQDHADGSLDQLLVSAQPLPVLALGKSIAHWLVSGAPLVLVSPMVAMSYKMPGEVVGVMMLSILLGTVSLSLLGATGAALTVGLHRGTTLLSLLLLPLAMPVLIFGARTVSLAVSGDVYSGGLFFLAAYATGAVTLTPFATAAALRISSE
jgi:heme exporter protein B